MTSISSKDPQFSPIHNKIEGDDLLKPIHSETLSKTDRLDPGTSKLLSKPQQKTNAIAKEIFDESLSLDTSLAGSKKNLQHISEVLHKYPQDIRMQLQEMHDILPDLINSSSDDIKEITDTFLETLTEFKKTSSGFEAHIDQLEKCLENKLDGHGKVTDDFKVLQQKLQRAHDKALHLETKIDLFKSSHDPLKIDNHLNKYSPSVYRELKAVHTEISDFARELKSIKAKSEIDISQLDKKTQGVDKKWQEAVKAFKEHVLPGELDRLQKLHSEGYQKHIKTLQSFLDPTSFSISKEGNIRGYDKVATEFSLLQQPTNLDQTAFNAQKLNADYLRSRLLH